jgi:hypothetical protein
VTPRCAYTPSGVTRYRYNSGAGHSQHLRDVEHGDLHTVSHATAQWIRVNGLSGDSVRVPVANRLTVETLDGWADQFLQEWGKAAGI